MLNAASEAQRAAHGRRTIAPIRRCRGATAVAGVSDLAGVDVAADGAWAAVAHAPAAAAYSPAAMAWRTDTIAARNTAVMVRLGVGCEDVEMGSSTGDRSSGDAKSASTSSKQSFWSHQMTEYVLGAVVLTQGLGGGVKIVPIVAGVLVVLLAATADGPLAVVKLVSRPLHRFADIASALVIVALSIVLRDESGAFATAVGLTCAVALAFLVVRTDYRPPTRRGLFGRASGSSAAPDQRQGSSTRTSPSGDDTPATPAAPARSEQIGRTAGRLAGRAARAAVDRTKGGKKAEG
jgi:hypothetical protein